MTPKQAEQLYRELFYGDIVGCSSDGDVVMKDTIIAAMMRCVDAPVLPASLRGWSNDAVEGRFKEVSLFLRDWANQLDAAGKAMVADRQ